MGGNARAVSLDTGEVIKFAGREAFAEQVDLKRHDVKLFKRDIILALQQLDTYMHLKTGAPLWSEAELKKMFLGSAALVWDDDFLAQFLGVKSYLGDIDVAVPEERLSDLFDVLRSLQGKRLGANNVLYIGQNRLKLRKPQINAVFFWNNVFVQIDFVGLPFENDEPSRFVTFARSSPKEDILQGVKGVAHKYLLMTLAWASSHRDDIVILTDKSPLPPAKVRLKTMHEPARVYSFSIDRGYRCRIAPCLENGKPVVVSGKFACKELPTSESAYTSVPSEIFERIFARMPKSNDMEEFGSFQGLIRLSTQYLGMKTTMLALEQMFRYKLYGPGQAMSRDSADADKAIKQKIIDTAKIWLPEVSSFDSLVKELQVEYYSRYHEREVEE